MSDEVLDPTADKEDAPEPLAEPEKEPEAPAEDAEPEA